MLYYFLTTAFPPIHLKSPPEMSFQELHELLLQNLSEKDLSLYREFLLYTDLKNVKAFLAEKPLDPRGFLSEKELLEAILLQDGLPEYVFSFLERFEGKTDRLSHYTAVYAEFLREERTGFLAQYFGLERSMRLILAALRAKKWGKDLIYEMQFEEIDDPFVAYILAQKDAQEFEPPEEFAEIKALFTSYESSPIDMEKKLLEYQIKKIEDFEEGKLFQMDQVLGFAAKLFLIESWHLLNQDAGKKALSQLV